MNARDELADILWTEELADWRLGPEEAADAILAAGYSKPRTITTFSELEALPFGSAVQTSDDSDTVVLRCEGYNFRNQSGADLSSTDLWRFGTHPFTVLYEAAA